jgi:hypothetical protein
LKASCLAEAEELVVDEAILDVVGLINVLHNFLTLFRYKVLDKNVSANGNPKAKVDQRMVSFICSCRNKK